MMHVSRLGASKEIAMSATYHLQTREKNMRANDSYGGADIKTHSSRVELPLCINKHVRGLVLVHPDSSSRCGS